MKVLPRLLALAALVSCSSNDGPAAALVVAINTGDLILPDDAGTVGLYLTQIDQDGRKRSVLAHEEKVTIVDGQPSVTFPGSLVVESHGEPARLLARFVAFRQETLEVLTMREARAAVPTDRQALLRLNLFVTNEGNVIDDRAGEPVVASDESGLALQQAADTVDPYARFRSVCDGAPAPEGQTSGDDGRCVPLDVTPEPRDPNAPMPGLDPDAGCYDLDETFRTNPDVVRALENLVLPESGECRIPLPGRFEATRLNVAIEGTAGFPSLREGAGASELRLRPLAAGLAFRIDPTDNTVVVSERACKVLRDHKVLFSQRTTAWGGSEPVCSPWSSAKKPGSFDDTPPTELPDADTARGFVVEAPSEGLGLAQLAVHDGEVVLIFGGQTHHLLRFAGDRFDTEAPPPVATDSIPSASAFYAPTFLTVPGSASPELYVLQGRSLHHLPRGGAPTPVQLDADAGARGLDAPAVAMAGGTARVFWIEGEGAAAPPLQVYNAYLGQFGSTTQVTVTKQATGPQLVNAQLAVERPQVTLRDDLWVVVHAPSAGDFGWWTIRDSNAGSNARLDYVEGSSRFASVQPSTRVGDALIAFGIVDGRLVTDGGNNREAFDYENPTAPFPYSEYMRSVVPVPGGFCGTTLEGRTVTCKTLAELRENAAGHRLLDGAQMPSLARDGDHIYVAYTCGAGNINAGQRVHVDRIPLERVMTGTLTSLCL